MVAISVIFPSSSELRVLQKPLNAWLKPWSNGPASCRKWVYLGLFVTPFGQGFRLTKSDKSYFFSPKFRYKDEILSIPLIN